MKLPLVLALLAIVIWSSLAVLGFALKGLSPFLIVGIALLTSGFSSMIFFKYWFVPFKTFLIGIMGIFGYHFLLFTAYHLSPAIEANLLNYLWPLLIVLFSSLILKGYHLKSYHIIGALLGLAGAVLIVSGGTFNIDYHYINGYLCAISAAVIWSLYSLFTKKVPPFSTKAVGGFCLVSGGLSIAVFFISEGNIQTILDLSGIQWLFLILLGSGPMGSAFFLWDAAMKNGDPRIIGALAYLTPLLSTLWLVFIGGNSLSGYVVMAMILIISGAVLGSLDLFFKKQTP